MILINKNSEIGQMVIEFLAMNKGLQGRILGYMRALREDYTERR